MVYAPPARTQMQDFFLLVIHVLNSYPTFPSGAKVVHIVLPPPIFPPSSVSKLDRDRMTISNNQGTSIAEGGLKLWAPQCQSKNSTNLHGTL